MLHRFTDDILRYFLEILAPDYDFLFDTGSNFTVGDEVTYPQVLYFKDFQGLCALSRVSRRLNHQAIPILYRNISMVDDGVPGNLAILHSLLNTLTERGFGQFTRIVNYFWVGQAWAIRDGVWGEIDDDDERELRQAGDIGSTEGDWTITDIGLFQHFLHFLSYRSTLPIPPLSNLSFRKLRDLPVYNVRCLHSDSMPFPVSNIKHLHVDKLHSCAPDIIIALSSFISVDHLSLAYEAHYPREDRYVDNDACRIFHTGPLDPSSYSYPAMTRLKSLVLKLSWDYTEQARWDDLRTMLRAFSGQLDAGHPPASSLEVLWLDLSFQTPYNYETYIIEVNNWLATLSSDALQNFKILFQYFSNIASIFPRLQRIHLLHDFFNEEIHYSIRGGEMESLISACAESLKASPEMMVIEIGCKQEYTYRGTVDRRRYGEGHLYYKEEYGSEWRDLEMYDKDVIRKARKDALNSCSWCINMDIF